MPMSQLIETLDAVTLGENAEPVALAHGDEATFALHCFATLCYMCV